MNRYHLFFLASILFLFTAVTSCGPRPDREYQREIRNRIAQYKEVTLSTNLDHLSENERKMIPILIEVADIMDEIFWIQSYGNKEQLMNYIDDEYARAYARINYGPWGRLEGHSGFYPGFDDKPLGANFYPFDMERQEFHALDHPEKTSKYTLIRRDTEGNLVVVPYREAFREQNERAASLLKEAAELADNPGFREYLELRAEAFLTDNYQPSDYAWMRMRDNNIDFVAGPLETGEDRKFGYKAAHSAYILIKEHEESQRLDRFAAMLPELQAALPVPEEYKSEVPGVDSDINVYDAIYYAGHCNAGPKMIALNLPHDAEVQQEAGTRSMQLQNSMEAKFDEILLPIADIVMHESQREYVTFDGFFENTTFHEIAIGMGIRNTITGKGTVREALREYHGIMEAFKADVMGLYLITKLYEDGQLPDTDLKEVYVTGFASIFRSSRFGTAGAHGIANMIRFNYLKERDAFTRHEDTGTYEIDFEKMKEVVEELVETVIIIQGDGNYEAARQIANTMGTMSDTLQKDIDRVSAQDIPVDIVFRQGLNYLDL